MIWGYSYMCGRRDSGGNGGSAGYECRGYGVGLREYRYRLAMPNAVVQAGGLVFLVVAFSLAPFQLITGL